MSRRNWKEARSKVLEQDEGRCRICKSTQQVQAAHVIPRSLAPGLDRNMGADNVVALCEPHHREYDQHRLDLLPYLTLREQLAAVEMAGGIGMAYRRTTNQRNLP